MNPLKLASLSLSRHSFSTTITVIAIGLSVACGGILLRLYQLSESRFSAMGRGGDAIVGAKAGGIEILLGSLNGEGEFPDFLPYKLFESLKAEQKVRFEDGAAAKASYIESIIPFVYFGKYNSYRVVGTDESFFQRPRPAESLPMDKGQWLSHADDVVLGSTVAHTSGLKVGDLIQVQPWLGKVETAKDISLRVSGILRATDSQWDRMLFSSVTEAHQVFAQNFAQLADKSIWGPQVLHYFLVYLHPGGFTPLEALVNRRTVGQVVDIEKQKARLQDISGAGRSVGLFVTAFVILLGGLAVCSMLITRFESMSLQLAVLRAIGYTKKDLAMWLLFEGLLLGIMGVTLGALIDLIGLPILRSLLGSALPPPELVASYIWDSAVIWITAIVAIMASVLIPMIRAVGQDTHSSLKGL